MENNSDGGAFSLSETREEILAQKPLMFLVVPNREMSKDEIKEYIEEGFSCLWGKHEGSSFEVLVMEVK